MDVAPEVEAPLDAPPAEVEAVLPVEAWADDPPDEVDAVPLVLVEALAEDPVEGFESLGVGVGVGLAGVLAPEPAPVFESDDAGDVLQLVGKPPLSLPPEVGEGVGVGVGVAVGVGVGVAVGVGVGVVEALGLVLADVFDWLWVLEVPPLTEGATLTEGAMLMDGWKLIIAAAAARLPGRA